MDFWTWYFIEDGWDYGYVEALVGGEWVTVPLYLDGTRTEVTTDTNPHDNNEEGNGLTGTSGGEYFVDEPGVHPPRRAHRCRRARPTCGSATRPTRRTSTPASSSTT